MKQQNIFIETRRNHEIFDALYDAYKWSNRFSEKVVRVDNMRTGNMKELHDSTLEEEIVEMRMLLKKASSKILYLNHLCPVLEKHYDLDGHGRVDLVFDFLDMVNDYVQQVEIAV